MVRVYGAFALIDWANVIFLVQSVSGIAGIAVLCVVDSAWHETEKISQIQSGYAKVSRNWNDLK